MISIYSESGLSCQFQNLDAATEAAKDYILARMCECDLSARVCIIVKGVFLKALTWEDIW
jgi:hypothetical protein